MGDWSNCLSLLIVFLILLLPITNYQLPITHHPSPITNNQQPTTNNHHPSPITNYQLVIKQLCRELKLYVHRLVRWHQLCLLPELEDL
ncbi:MAG TPA: hypothetical protein DDZ80_02475 [Cyanobacteria bacterium UBA8803]|nr:hypothetical protein [Cyanobacteria bacterium UBA9273]HBL57448.1 hypothetical protein [Cyanobacteria bacterium UBA8803]